MNQKNKEFNKIMNGFIKNFNKIINEENILKNIGIWTRFFRKCNGSKFMLDWWNKYNTESIEILDFWKETDEWELLNFSWDFEKYIWAFIEYNTSSYSINIKQLESFYDSINKKN